MQAAAAEFPSKPRMLVTLDDSATILPAAARKSLLTQFMPLTSDGLPIEPKDLMAFWATIESALKILDETFKDLTNPLLFTV